MRLARRPGPCLTTPERSICRPAFSGATVQPGLECPQDGLFSISPNRYHRSISSLNLRFVRAVRHKRIKAYREEEKAQITNEEDDVLDL